MVWPQSKSTVDILLRLIKRKKFRSQRKMILKSEIISMISTTILMMDSSTTREWAANSKKRKDILSFFRNPP